MRVISVFAAAAVLAVSWQPAWAVCVNRGGAQTCIDDSKFGDYEPTLVNSTPADAPGTSGKTIELHPAGSGHDAWVLAPQSTTEGAAVLSSADANAATLLCGSGVSC